MYKISCCGVPAVAAMRLGYYIFKRAHFVNGIGSKTFIRGLKATVKVSRAILSER